MGRVDLAPWGVEAGRGHYQPQHPDATWRGYYSYAEQILTLYKDNQHGYGCVADEMNRAGWAFRNRWNQPRPINGDDVRRVTSNWREYAELVMHGRAKEQLANEIDNPSGVLYDTGRAVFSLELLYAVAKTQEERSVTTRPTKSVSPAHIFALSFLTFCALRPIGAGGRQSQVPHPHHGTQQEGAAALPSFRQPQVRLQYQIGPGEHD